MSFSLKQRYRLAIVSLALCAPVLTQSKWRLVWSDEFNGPANSEPSKWSRDLGATGWGNDELQNYTNTSENAHLDGNGHLVIRAIHTASGEYTSARLKTQGKYTATYGRIEARIRVPSGVGMWPAFWMMGADSGRGWPRCGEIDIMEIIGREPSVVRGTIHGPGYSGAEGITGQYTLPNGQRFSDDFHVFAVEWEPDLIRWYIDSRLYHIVSRANLPPGGGWVFDHPFFLLLDLAVGGRLPGNPDASTPFPQDMLVDYVRVWERASI